MFKLTGALLVVGASSLMGFGFSYRLIERCRLLKLWLHILEILKVEINYQCGLLPEVFAKIALIIDDGDFKRAFGGLARLTAFGTGVELKEVWRKFLEETGSFHLTGGDYLILNELGNYLGGTDREDQCEKIRLCQSRLQNNLNTAESDRHKKLKLFRYLGFATGAALVLFLL